MHVTMDHNVVACSSYVQSLAALTSNGLVQDIADTLNIRNPTQSHVIVEHCYKVVKER